MSYEFNVKAPSQAEADDKAYSDYVSKGDEFFRAGLSKKQFIEQRNNMINDYQSHAKSQPHFYSPWGDRYE